MRKFLAIATLLIVCGLSLHAQQANPVINVCTDLDNWTVTNAQGAQVNPVEVLPGCLDPALIACLCRGTGQEDPVICTPAGAMEIWGETWGCIQRPNGCNIPCSYRANTYTFTRTIPIDDCSIIDSIHFDVQGDNRLVLNFNGFNIVTTANADWARCFDETDATGRLNVANYNAFLASLTPGQDLVITATVTNIDGAPCINYAYFSFCADLFVTTNLNLDATFTLSDQDLGGGNALLLGNANPALNPPGVNHEWYISSAPWPSTDPFTPLGVIQGGTSFTLPSPYCINYEVIHRVFWGDCEECFRLTNPVTCDQGGKPDGELENEGGIRRIVDCSRIRGIDWPVLDGRGGGKGGERSGKTTFPSRISPNPAQEVINISWDARTSMKNLQLFSVDGKLVKSNNLQEGSTLHSLKVSDLAPGTYFLRLTDSEGNIENHKVEVLQ
jgi:hypothetical protein